MTSFNSDRRKFLAGTGAAALTALAGCAAFQDGRGVPGSTEPVDDDEEEDERDGRIPQNVHDYLVENEAGGYEGSVTDLTGEGSITVDVGAGSGLSFSPVVAAIDPGTEVTYEWTGEGGGHNVAASGPTDFDEDVESEIINQAGHTASQTFEEEGVYVYECTPHVGAGMFGALLIGDTGDGDGDAVADYMEENDVNLWEGEIVDVTGEEQVTVENGAGAGLAFDPPAVRVDAGAEITWEWTGDGGAHNVEATEAPADWTSGDPVDEAGNTWSRTFEEGGNHFYHCTPHTDAGMHGVIVVEGDGDEAENGEEEAENGADETENGEEEAENGEEETTEE